MYPIQIRQNYGRALRRQAYRTGWVNWVLVDLKIFLELAQIPVGKEGAESILVDRVHVNHDVVDADVAMQNACFFPCFRMT